jgi:hypothetical protein
MPEPELPIVRDRGELLNALQWLENNHAAVHIEMRLYYAGELSLEEALIRALLRFSKQNSELVIEAMRRGPGPVIIVKP